MISLRVVFSISSGFELILFKLDFTSVLSLLELNEGAVGEVQLLFFQMSTSRTLAPSNISRIVNLWLSLVPDCLRSTSVESSGYDQYVRNAQTMLPDIVRKCQGFEWSVEATFPQERFALSQHLELVLPS